MVFKVPDAGLALESSAKSTAALPQQAFAVSLDDKAIEDMIECVQNGQDIQLSLGDTPAFLLGGQEYHIPDTSTPSTYDLFFSNSTNPKTLNRLPNPAMGILHQRKYHATVQKALKAGKDKPKDKPKPKPPKPRSTATKPTSSQRETGDADADIEALQLQLAQAEAEKLEHSTRVIGGPLTIKGGKVKPGKVKLLGTQAGTPARSHPSSPALNGVPSPSLGPINTAKQLAQERTKSQRFPIIHELAVKERTFEDLVSEWDEGTEQEFQTALEKVASFDDDLQKWSMNKLYWKELDVFKYPYKKDDDRQRAIDNAIRQYDRMRLGVSDPLWQKLLPRSERGKGICLSKLQATIAKGPQPPTPKINLHKADGSSTNASGDSEKDDSGQGRKTKGGESMSRSSSQTKAKKMTDSQAQAKRLLSTSKKPAPAKASPRDSPKASPTKTTKAPAAKGGRVLSKEFISDSDSESEEAPLAKTVLKPKPKPAPKPVAERPAEKPKAVEKARVASAPKPKPAAKPAPHVKETINAQIVARSTKPLKRSREDDDDDDSSSSGTPLSKRFKPKEQAAKISGSVTKHHASDLSQNGRGTSSGASMAKSKNTSPVKSSPLASSPPTNASDLDPADERDTIVARKRKADDSCDSIEKRQRLSPKVLQKAHRFKKFYASYEALHKEIVGLEHPPAAKVTDLLDMRERLRLLKSEIYEEIPPEN